MGSNATGPTAAGFTLIQRIALIMPIDQTPLFIRQISLISLIRVKPWTVGQFTANAIVQEILLGT